MSRSYQSASEPGWVAKQIHKIDKLDNLPGDQTHLTTWQPSGPLTNDSGKMQQVRYARIVVAAQSTIFYPPQNGYWIILSCTALNTLRAGEYYANIRTEPGNIQTLVSVRQTAASANLAADCLTGIYKPLILKSGAHLQIWNHNYVGGDTNHFFLQYVEVTG